MLDEQVGQNNLMAGQRPICERLLEYYKLKPEEKEKYLSDRAGAYLFSELPKNVARILKKGFLNGLQASEISDWDIVVDFMNSDSDIIKALTKDPGTFTMLERMYHFHEVRGILDNYFLLSVAGGQSLRYRYEIVNQVSARIIKRMLKEEKNIEVVDFGSGPGRNIIDIIKNNPEFIGRLNVDCVDTDKDALNKGKILLKDSGLKMINYLEGSMMNLGNRYRHSVDFGLLIGVLCGMEYRMRVILLRRLRKYFKPGGKLLAAALLDDMAKKDLLCAYILREVTAWHLEFRPLGELKQAFEEAGWIYDGYFQERPTRLYEIGIATAP